MKHLKNKMIRCLGRVMLLCLCAVMIAGTALANEIVDIGVEGYDTTGYDCTLPDGRMIFTGSQGEPGNYMNSRARILCLNPDKTVSWEYIDSAEGSWSAHGVTLMKDGTLCVRLCNSPYQTRAEDKLVFFTQDGQPTGREIQLDVTETKEGYFNYGICDFGIITYYHANDSDDRDKEYREYTDWDGNKLFRLDGPEMLVARLIEEEDGIVLLGNERGQNGAAKIMKIDWQGNTVWENTLPFITEANRGAMIHCGIQTSDGGYLGVLLERPLDLQDKWKTALVKFSSTGRVLWMNEESFDKQPSSMFEDLIEYDGKYVLEFEDKERFDSLKMPVRYLWFDAEGKELGITELYIRKEELPRLADSKEAQASGWMMLVMEDGLWGNFICCNDSENHENNMASMDGILMKIPEL